MGITVITTMCTAMPEPPISFTDHLDPPDDSDLLDDPRVESLGTYQRGIRQQARDVLRQARQRERLAQRALEDQEKRAWIEAGNEIRQPPEYRGRVFSTADRDGVHPTAYPPLRESAGGELTDEFIAFQAHNQVRYETHPEYYCVACKIRYNARDGGMCGPCLGERTKTADSTPRSRRLSPESGSSLYPT